MKVLSRLASPAGFALVLLLFFLLPFLSVSCEVPGIGNAGVDYGGANLVTGSDPTPEIPEELKELGAGTSGTGATDEPPPDPGVQLLAIITVALAAIGIGTVLISRLKPRLLSAAGVAVAALVMTIATLIVAKSNIEAELIDEARETGAAETTPGVPDIESIIDEIVNSEIGFWLVVVGLGLIAAANVGAALLRTRAASTGAVPVTGPPPQPDPPPDNPPQPCTPT